MIDNKLQLEAACWTEYWLKNDGHLTFKWGDLADEHRQAAHARVQGALHRYKPSKGALRTWARPQVYGAVQDAARADGAGLIGTRRGKSMPVNIARFAAHGRQGDGDSILDYPADDAPGRDLASGVRGSDFEPIFDAQPVTPTDPDERYTEDYKQAPISNRKFHRDQRIHIHGEHHNAKERLLALSQDNRWTPEQTIKVMDDSDVRREIFAPETVPNPKMSPAILALRAVTNCTVSDATVPTTLRQIDVGRAAYLATAAFFERFYPDAHDGQKMRQYRNLLRTIQTRGILASDVRKWPTHFEQAAAMWTEVREQFPEIAKAA